MKHLLVALQAFVSRGGDSKGLVQRRSGAVLQVYGGDWIGRLDVSGTPLPLVLHVDADAVQPVTLDSPSQGFRYAGD